MLVERATQATALSRYWNALVRGDSIAIDIASELDAETVASVALVRSGRWQESPSSQFVNNLEMKLRDLQPGIAPGASLAGSTRDFSGSIHGVRQRAGLLLNPQRWAIAAVVTLLIITATAWTAFEINDRRTSVDFVPAKPEAISGEGVLAKVVLAGTWPTLRETDTTSAQEYDENGPWFYGLQIKLDAGEELPVHAEILSPGLMGVMTGEMTWTGESEVQVLRRDSNQLASVLPGVPVVLQPGDHLMFAESSTLLGSFSNSGISAAMAFGSAYSVTGGGDMWPSGYAGAPQTIAPASWTEAQVGATGEIRAKATEVVLQPGSTLDIRVEGGQLLLWAVDQPVSAQPIGATGLAARSMGALPGGWMRMNDTDSANWKVTNDGDSAALVIIWSVIPAGE